MTGRLWGALERNALLVMMVSAAGAALLGAFLPITFVGDTWMSLVGGREIVRHGLPRVDHLTVYGEGRTWTNQQWLAHLFFYGLDRLGGYGLVGVVAGLCATGAYALAVATARLRGGSMRAVMIVGAIAIFTAPWTWTVRAQVLALPLYALLLFLLVEARDGIRRRTFLVIPAVALWGNVHGSATMAAVLVTILAVLEIARRRKPLIAAGLALGTWAAIFVTPYSPAAIVRYYRLLLVDPPFADLVTEWQRPKPGWSTLAFGLLLLLAAYLVLRRWRSFALVELAILGATAVVALQAVRGLFWFSLACVVILPQAMRARPLADKPGLPAVDRVLAALSLAAVALAAVLGGLSARERIEADWPPALATAVARAAGPGQTTVLGSDRWSDWLLWTIPALRGRVADDVRFEIYPRSLFLDRVRYNGEIGPDWKRYADGFGVVVLDESLDASHRADFLAEPGARVVFRRGDVTVIRRAD